MKIENLRIKTVEGDLAAIFTVDEVECCEWVSISFDDTHYIPERTDSHMRSHCDSNHDVDDILDALTLELEKYGLGQ